MSDLKQIVEQKKKVKSIYPAQVKCEIAWLGAEATTSTTVKWTWHICIFNEEKTSVDLHEYVSILYRDFATFLFLSTTWNELCCSCMEDVSTRGENVRFQAGHSSLILELNWYDRLVHCSGIVSGRFVSRTTWNNREMMAEKRSYNFRWRSRCQLFPWLSSLMICKKSHDYLSHRPHSFPYAEVY